MASIVIINGESCLEGLPVQPTAIDKCSICDRALLEMTANNDWKDRNVHLRCFAKNVTKKRFRTLTRLIREEKFPVIMSANGNLFI